MNDRTPMFNGKVVIVTGAGGGIGRAHAIFFAKEGAKVVVNDVGGSRDGVGGDSSMADQVVKEIKAFGGEAAANYDSVATMDGANSLLKTAIDNFGRVDVLVNNAGILRDKTLMKMEEGQWDSVIAVHLKGTFCCTQVIARKMIEQNEGGRIINTTSYAGLIGNFGQSNYSAAKAGIYGFTVTTALELRSKGITVNAVAPMAKTRMTTDIDMIPDEMAPEQISPLVLYLASDLAADVTGKIFGVHGQQIFPYVMKMYEGVTKAGKDFWTPAEIHARFADIMREGAAPAAAAAAPAPAAPAAPALPSDPVEAAFSLVPLGFVEEKAAGKSFNIFFDLKGGPPHSLILENGKLRVVKGQEGTPTCVTSTDADTMVGIFSGKVKAESAFMQGKIKASNLQNMMTLGQVLNAKKAQEAIAARGTAAAAAPAAAAPAAAPAAPSDPVSEAFSLVPLGFMEDKAAGKSFNIFFDLKGGPPHSLILEGGKLRVVKGQEGTPTCVTTTDAETMVGIFSGKLKAESAFMQGKIKASNLQNMMTLGQVLNAKKAQEALAARGSAAPAPAAPAAAAAAAGDPVSTAFSLVPLGFMPEKAGGKKFNIFFDITGGPAHSLILADGKLSVVKGQQGTPSCTTKTDADTIVAIFTAKLRAESAFMQGKIKASNVADMMALGQVLDSKKAQAVMAAQGTNAAMPAAGQGGHPADMMGAAGPQGDPVAAAFSMLPQGFQKEKAGNWKACIHFEIKGSTDRTLDVAEGHVKVLEGKIGNADCLIKTDSETISGLLTGKVDGQKAFMQGKISASNMGVLMKFSQFFVFDARKAAPAAAAPAAASAAAPAAAPVKDRRQYIGRKYDGGFSFARPEHMIAYAKATNDENPAFIDTAREGGIVAPPLFPVRLFNDCLYKVATDSDLELDLVRLVHGEQDMKFHEPIQPMDILQIRAQIADIQEKESGTVVAGRIYAYKDGRLAVEATSSLFIRARARKKDPSEVAAKQAEVAAEKAAPVDRGAPTFTSSFKVDADQAARYADASLDRNPIHLDEGAARGAGLPGVILHGLCTMAMSTRPFVQELCGGDPTRLKRFSVRFSKPVFPGDTLTVKAWADADKKGSYAFEVTNASGAAVVTHGVAEVA